MDGINSALLAVYLNIGFDSVLELDQFRREDFRELLEELNRAREEYHEKAFLQPIRKHVNGPESTETEALPSE